MKKIIAILLVLTMLLSMLIACDKADDSITSDTDKTSSESTADTTDTESSKESSAASSESESESESESASEETEDDSDITDAPDPDAPATVIISNKKSDFTIVIPDSNADTLTEQIQTFRSTIAEDYNVNMPMYKESTFKTLNGGTLDGPKIVIGSLKSDSTCTALKGKLDRNSFTIRMINGSLYILGGTTEATIAAIQYFMNNCMPYPNPVLQFRAGVVYETNSAFPLGNLTVAGNAIVDYKIVYCDSYYGKLTAESLSETLVDYLGVKLPVVSESTAATKLEILVGKTNRTESKSVRAAYDRPNVNYDIVEKNGKLVLMAEGFSTLEVVSKELIKYFNSIPDGHNIVGTAVSGDVLISDNKDNVAEGNMLKRAEGTEVRVMAWNMGGPGTYGKVDLAEKLADTILKNLPDVLGTNEFYDPATGAYRTTFNIVMREISDYYYEIESDNDFPNDSRLETFIKQRGPRPQKIFIRKDAGLKVIAAGWRYTEYQKDINYRSFPWAVLETKAGERFIYTVSHYTNMANDTSAAVEQLATVAYAQQQSGSSKALPVILSGDLYMKAGGGSYAMFEQNGYSDAQKTARINDNYNIAHSTFHDYGKLEPIGRGLTDFIMYSSGFDPLKFKVITSKEAMDSSDHYPVICDFRIY